MWSPIISPETPVSRRCGLPGVAKRDQVIAFFTLAGDIGKWRKRFPLS
jgi:hypothetical protein